MIDDLKIVNAEEINSETVNGQRPYKTARRRSLSGSAVPSKTVNRRVNFGFKIDKLKLRHSDEHKDYDSTDTILSELGSMDKSIDSLSSSSGINVSDVYRKSNCSDNSVVLDNEHRRKSHSVSAKMKIKHFLAEHLVKTHPCQHPEYHFHRKESENTISIYDSKNTNLNESDFPEYSSRASSNASIEVSSPRPRSEQGSVSGHNSLNIASSILDRIRQINIQSFNPTHKHVNHSTNGNDHNSSKDLEPNSPTSNDSQTEFPFPEPNPCKLPRVISPSSLAFSSKHILTSKRQRLAHSISYDPDYVVIDPPKTFSSKRLSHAMSMCPEFIPEKDKWERKISGYLDTSTSTGATLTAINFGLKRVTETDKYLMITKSPTSCPNDFLEEGISHIEETSQIYQSLMRHSTCYDVMPDSGKVIIIDSQMQIGRAFDAIEDHIVRGSPIWSSESHSFVALLTVNDLVPLLLHLHQERNKADHCCESVDNPEDFSTVTVKNCLTIIPRYRSLQNHLVGIPPEANLHMATTVLNQFHKTMVLVIDTFLSGNALFLLTSLRILTYLFYKAHSVSLESCFSTKIYSSELLANQNFEFLTPLSDAESTCQSLCVSSPGKTQFLIKTSSSIVDILRAMALSYYCCALISESDVTDGKNKYTITNVITMADILHMVKINKHRDPTVTVTGILEWRRLYKDSMTYRDPVVTCCVNDSIHHLINLVVKEKASFVLVRSNDDIRSFTVGVLNAHDIVNYIDNLPYNTSELHNGSHYGKSERCRRNVNKYSADNKFRSQSDVVGAMKHRPSTLDNNVDEVFDDDITE